MQQSALWTDRSLKHDTWNIKTDKSAADTSTDGMMWGDGFERKLWEKPKTYTDPNN